MGERQLINKRAVAYIRVANAAHDEDAQQQIVRQRQTCAEIARTFKAEIVDEYMDIRTSGRTLQRPGLQHLVRRCTNGDIHYAIASDDARFSRDATTTIELHDVLRRRGTSILTNVSAPVDEPYSTLVRVIAEMDHHQRSERAKDGWAKRRATKQRSEVARRAQP